MNGWHSYFFLPCQQMIKAMNNSKNNHDNLNEGGKRVVNDPKITEIIANNKHTIPSQYEEKINDGIRIDDQPLTDNQNSIDPKKALEAGSK